MIASIRAIAREVQQVWTAPGSRANRIGQQFAYWSLKKKAQG